MTKKRWILALFSVILFFLCGCTGNQAEQTPDYHKMTATQAPSPTGEKAPQAALEESTPEPSPEVTPSPTQTEKPKNTVVASATTNVVDKTAPRVHNIRTAAKAINGKVIKKGAVFSFNDAVGPRTADKGYKIAPVLVGKEHTEGEGGGVCQLSTTLFQAADKLGLTIVERHKHELEVAYAKGGTDATVNYGTMDLKIKNNADYDIRLSASVSGKKVVVKLIRINASTGK